MTHRQKYYTKWLIMTALFVACYVGFGLFGLGATLGPPVLFIAAAFLPSLLVAFVLWPGVWSPSEASPRQVRVHQIVSIAIYVTVAIAQMGIAWLVNSRG